MDVTAKDTLFNSGSEPVNSVQWPVCEMATWDSFPGSKAIEAYSILATAKFNINSNSNFTPYTRDHHGGKNINFRHKIFCDIFQFK